jgi:uncharacterized protein involved in exopolysaccharide biosynthesis
VSLSGTKATDDITIPSNIAPQLGQEYLNIARELLFREDVYRILLRQYELARIDEFSDQNPVYVQVIDIAQPPIHKSAPKRLRIILLNIVLGLLLGALVVLVKNRKEILFTTED